MQCWPHPRLGAAEADDAGLDCTGHCFGDISEAEKMTVHNRKKKFTHKVENIGTIYQRLKVKFSLRSLFCNFLLKDGDTDDYGDYLEDDVDLQLLDDEDGAGDHYLLSDGKTYIVLLGVIAICGATVVSNIFFPSNKDKLDSQNTEDMMDQPDGRGAKPFLHPTMKVRSLMGGEVDVDYINEQITKVTRYEYVSV